MQHLFGFTPLDPSLCVADVQVLWVLRVEICHNVHPSEEQCMKHVQETAPVAERQPRKERWLLLFAVDGRMLPTGFSNQDPVFHLIGGERSPAVRR